MLEKTLESPLDREEITPVHPKGNQPWLFTGRTDAEAKAPILWPPDVKRWLIRKDPDAGKDWRQEEMGMTEDEMVGWHGHEFEQTPGDGERQGSLAWYSPWGCRVRHGTVTEHHQSWPKGKDHRGPSEPQVTGARGRKDHTAASLSSRFTSCD